MNSAHIPLFFRFRSGHHDPNPHEWAASVSTWSRSASALLSFVLPAFGSDSASFARFRLQGHHEPFPSLRDGPPWLRTQAQAAYLFLCRCFTCILLRYRFICQVPFSKDITNLIRVIVPLSLNLLHNQPRCCAWFASPFIVFCCLQAFQSNPAPYLQVLFSKDITNGIRVMGRLGFDPELRRLISSYSVASPASRSHSALLQVPFSKEITNHIRVMGRLGFDPELKRLETGRTVTKMRIALSKPKSVNSDSMDEAEWCVRWPLL